MNNMEHIFLCLVIPYLLLLLFIRGKQSRAVWFAVIGMGMSLFSSYVTRFYMEYLQANPLQAMVEITPVCEEVMKAIPLVMWIFIARPKSDAILPAALFLAVGFATFENVCYMTANGADDIRYLLLRGFSAGAVHMLCGLAVGYGLTFVYKRRYLALIGTVAVIGACSVFHGIYNLLGTAEANIRLIGYALPMTMILLVIIGKKIIFFEKR